MPPLRSRRRLLIHGRILSLGHLAVLSACLFNILATVALMTVASYTMLACIRDLGISLPDAAAWYSEWRQTSAAPSSLEQHVREVAGRWEVISAHLRQVREGYAVPMACLMAVLAALSYILIWVVWNYLYEGRAEWRLAGAAALLERARAALPPEFPPTRLVAASRTFVRHRLRGGITTYLSGRMLVRLLDNQEREFQFALFHEEFHLRCLDSLCNSVSLSLRRILAVLGAAACALIGMEFLSDLVRHHVAAPVATFLRVATLVLIFLLVFRRLVHLDGPFLKHRELLADRYAWSSRPDADLDVVYDRDNAERTHPSRAERLRFLRERTCSTAHATFFTSQEILLCCVALISLRTFEGPLLGTLPRALDIPCFVLALVGTLILGAEACAHPFPAADREALLGRAVLTTVACLLLAGRAQAPWFSGMLVAANLIVLLRIASGRGERSPVAAGPAPRAAPPTAALREPSRRIRALRLAGAACSWLALLWVAGIALVTILQLVLFQVLGMPTMFQAPKFPPVGKTLLDLARAALVVFAAVRNLKRPNALTLGVEWLFYAAMLLAFCLMGLFLSALAQGPDGLVPALLQLPLNDGPAVQRQFWATIARVDLWRSLFVTLPPQLALAGFYFWRVRDASARRRKEREEC